MATVTDNSYNILHDKSIKIASKAKVCPMSNENHDIKDCSKQCQKNSVSCSKSKYVMDLCKQCQGNIMQRFAQADITKCAM